MKFHIKVTRVDRAITRNSQAAMAAFAGDIYTRIIFSAWNGTPHALILRVARATPLDAAARASTMLGDDDVNGRGMTSISCHSIKCSWWSAETINDALSPESY